MIDSCFFHPHAKYQPSGLVFVGVSRVLGDNKKHQSSSSASSGGGRVGGVDSEAVGALTDSEKSVLRVVASNEYTQLYGHPGQVRSRSHDG
jgi:hypothetical protein